MQPPPQLVTTLYREILRSCRRTRAVMRPGHVSLVGQCVQRFADSSSPSLIAAVKEHGPLPLPGLVRHAFRSTEPSAAGDMCDDAFRALRMLHHVEEWVNTSARYTAVSIPLKFSLLTPLCFPLADNELYDSLEGLSDREAPAQESTHLIAAQLLAQAESQPTRIQLQSYILRDEEAVE